jgi:hypothetical protein
MNDSNYYNRTAIITGTGHIQWRQDEDAAIEALARQELGAMWGCEVVEYPMFHAIDWYCVIDNRIVGHVEFKGRNHPVGQYPTVYMSQRKYLTLWLSELATGVPSFFVVRWGDGTMRYLPISRVATGAPVVKGAGKLRNGEARLSVEPLFEVPVNDMLPIGGAP